jgi:hypothetical protein
MDNINQNEEFLTQKEKSPFSFIGKVFGAILIIISLLFLFIVLTKNQEQGQMELNESMIIETGTIEQPAQEQKFNF